MFWYFDELDRLDAYKAQQSSLEGLVFYGSSTFTLWNELPAVFENYQPINLAFGGSTLSACAWYFDRVFKNVDATGVIVYAGDNDLGDGRHPLEVVLFWEALYARIRKQYPNIPVSIISIKPSLNRWHLAGNINYANKQLELFVQNQQDDLLFFVNIYDAYLNEFKKPDAKYFVADGLHFNAEGYRLLEEILKFHQPIFPKQLA